MASTVATITGASARPMPTLTLLMLRSMETSALLVAALTAPSEAETAVDMELALARWVDKNASINGGLDSNWVF
jgi:hypothetical protein